MSDNPKFPSQSLKNWFLANRRSLPWREDPSPYRVWVSEVMLQQTQVAVVIPYFERWMEAFPTIEALAAAPIEKVIKLWEGLGYYSRARHLHAGAQFVQAHHGGQLPRDSLALSQIKGLGPYTQGAIRSFAFHEKVAAVDGNVMRVLSRFFAIQEAIDTTKTRNRLTSQAQELLPDQEPWLVTEGLIELGATVCTKKPQCGLCPLMSSCLGYRHGLATSLPKRQGRQKTIKLQRLVAVIECEGAFLVNKGEKGKVMADLYEFPYLELMGKESIERRFAAHLGIELAYAGVMPEEQQSFTRYQVALYPHRLRASKRDLHHSWKTRKELVTLPFSSGHRRILEKIL